MAEANNPLASLDAIFQSATQNRVTNIAEGGSEYGGHKVSGETVVTDSVKHPEFKIGGKTIPGDQHIADLKKASEMPNAEPIHAENLKKAGGVSVKHIDGELKGVQEARTALDKEAAALVGGGQHTHEVVNDVVARHKEQLTKYEEVLMKERESVIKTTGYEAAALEKAGAKIVTEAGKSYPASSEAAKSLGAIGEAEHAALGGGIKGTFSKMRANAKANWNISKVAENGDVVARGTLGKVAKGATVGLGAVVAGYGAKDIGQYIGIISPDTDDQGKEVPADAGKLIKGAAELGGGAALVYASLLRGGAAKGI